MSIEHAPQSEHRPLTTDSYQKLQDEVALLDATISEIDANINSPNFYDGDRETVDESREFFKQRREEAIRKLSTHTLFVTSAAA